MNRLQLGLISSSPLCIERMLWGMTLVICRACFKRGDFLLWSRVGGGLGGDMIWVVCVRCGRWCGLGRLGGIYERVCKTSVAVISQFVTDTRDKKNQIRVTVAAMI